MRALPAASVKPRPPWPALSHRLRHGVAPISGLPSGRAGRRPAQGCGCPVSYTHLDVYKRQVEAITAAEAEIGMPASVETRFQGAALAFQNSLSSTLWLILAAIVTMYIVLGVLYESLSLIHI